MTITLSVKSVDPSYVGEDGGVQVDYGRRACPRTNPLSLEDRGVIQGALDLLTEEALRHGLTITVEHDFDEFARLRKLVGDGGCHPSVDPRHSNVTKDAFWLRIVDQDDTLVAIMAERIYRCGDFMALFRNTRIWFDKEPPIVSPEYKPLPAFEPFGGVVGYGCALWVHPAARRHGVASFLPDYYRGITLQEYEVDWHTCVVFEHLGAPFAKKVYKFPDVGLIIDGYCPACTDDYTPVEGKMARVYLCRISRRDMLEHLRSPKLSLSFTRIAPPSQAAAAG